MGFERVRVARGRRAGEPLEPVPGSAQRRSRLELVADLGEPALELSQLGVGQLIGGQARAPSRAEAVGAEGEQRDRGGDGAEDDSGSGPRGALAGPGYDTLLRLRLGNVAAARVGRGPRVDVRVGRRRIRHPEGVVVDLC
jgi:hypothetical protein